MGTTTTRAQGAPAEAMPGRAAADVAKKAWRQPRILSREPLEAVAGACGDSGGKSNAGACPTGPVSS